MTAQAAAFGVGLPAACCQATSRRTRLVPIVLTLACLSAPAQAQRPAAGRPPAPRATSPPSAPAPVAPAWLLDVEGQWAAAFNAGKASALAEFYAEDAVIFVPGHTARGRSPIDAFWSSSFANAQYACRWPIEGVQALDKLVMVWGRSSCVVTPTSGGAALTQDGRWARVYEVQEDGSWLIVRDIGQ